MDFVFFIVSITCNYSYFEQGWRTHGLQTLKKDMQQHPQHFFPCQPPLLLMYALRDRAPKYAQVKDGKAKFNCGFCGILMTILPFTKVIYLVTVWIQANEKS